MKPNYFIVTVDEHGVRQYLLENGKYSNQLQYWEGGRIGIFTDLDKALALAGQLDALVMTEGFEGLVTV